MTGRSVRRARSGTTPVPMAVPMAVAMAVAVPVAVACPATTCRRCARGDRPRRRHVRVTCHVSRADLPTARPTPEFRPAPQDATGHWQ
ncbi:hypothetical protein [Streptomyces europaeiscabiei]|uniref:hypothetical protein n=1 Tax=Streptomyces europaeiscabiei TaxID=146819 RepID=UPI002E14A78C|nr:hypothetical protein OHB30_27460 [Streptomyces europaeiscabiei]